VGRVRTPPPGTAAAAANVPTPPLGSPAAWLAASLGIVLCVGVADFLTGRDVALILFYLAPIGFGTWYVGLRGGVALAVVSALVSVGADTLNELAELGGQHQRMTLVVVLWNGLVQLGTFASLVLVLSALRSRLEGEELLARTDALTHIANRRAFFEAAAMEIERARRSRRPLALAFVDVDDFKDVNDGLGHAQGDALLVAVAQTLRTATRAVDSVARLGGDEFAILLPETPAAEVEPLLARVRAALAAAMARHGWRVGFSFGAAIFLEPPASTDELVARADELMYAAKRDAKGSVRTATYGAPQAAAHAESPGTAAGRR
jgi:diguanylate cyclase (GGDEF)-like protein